MSVCVCAHFSAFLYTYTCVTNGINIRAPARMHVCVSSQDCILAHASLCVERLAFFFLRGIYVWYVPLCLCLHVCICVYTGYAVSWNSAEFRLVCIFCSCACTCVCPEILAYKVLAGILSGVRIYYYECVYMYV
jgi:hypothetical protein